MRNRGYVINVINTVNVINPEIVSGTPYQPPKTSSINFVTSSGTV